MGTMKIKISYFEENASIPFLVHRTSKKWHMGPINKLYFRLQKLFNRLEYHEAPGKPAKQWDKFKLEPYN